MGKRSKRFAAFLWLTAAIGAAGASIFGKPAKVKNSGKADRYIYTFGKKKKNSAEIVAVTNVRPHKAARIAAKNFFKNIF
ncbi:MAG: hypothetical protein J1E40_02650 [Oscillospiraceae bacterium]|nr:hypothetical protein [Oscillospiraceae bacterium]